MLKRFILIIISVTILCSTTVFASFPDINEHWAAPYAIDLNQRGIFKGDDLGNANLGSNIKRSEFLALLIRSVFADETIPTGKLSFSDVKKGSWYYDIASFAKEKGIILGDTDGNLMPEAKIKREEIVLMTVRCLDLTGGEANFTDIKKSYVYYKEIAAAVHNGIITGYTDGTFWPKAYATRGESCAIISRILKPDNTPEETPAPIEKEKINLTWHQIYNKDVKVTGNHMDGLNVISPTWFRIVDNTDKTPYSYETRLDGGLNLWMQDLGNNEYIKDAKNEGYLVWALFKTDFTPSITHKFLSSDAARASAVKQIVSLVKKYNLDGINMDFENMYVSDKDKYTQFVREMSVACNELGITLSVDITKYEATGGTWSLCYDRAEIAKVVDYVALMAYDEYGTWSTKGGSVASLPWVENAVLKTLEEVPAEKLLLGVPFYTRLWEEKNGVVVKTSAIGMKTAMNKISEAGAQIVFDKKTGQNYAEWTADGKVYKIWLEDETSMKSRLNLIQKYNLAGVASWSKTFETPNIWTLIKDNL